MQDKECCLNKRQHKAICNIDLIDKHKHSNGGGKKDYFSYLNFSCQRGQKHGHRQCSSKYAEFTNARNIHGNRQKFC